MANSLDPEKFHLKMAVIYPNLCYNEVCYKGTVLYCIFNYQTILYQDEWKNLSVKKELRMLFYPAPKVIKLFSCSNQHEIQLLIKSKIMKVFFTSCFKILRCFYILLINVKMPTIVGILTFMSRINVMIS